MYVADGFRYFGEAGGDLDCSLQYGFVHMVPADHKNRRPNTACSGRWGLRRIFGDPCSEVKLWGSGLLVRPTAR